MFLKVAYKNKFVESFNFYEHVDSFVRYCNFEYPVNFSTIIRYYFSTHISSTWKKEKCEFAKEKDSRSARNGTEKASHGGTEKENRALKKISNYWRGQGRIVGSLADAKLRVLDSTISEPYGKSWKKRIATGGRGGERRGNYKPSISRPINLLVKKKKEKRKKKKRSASIRAAPVIK